MHVMRGLNVHVMNGLNCACDEWVKESMMCCLG